MRRGIAMALFCATLACGETSGTGGEVIEFTLAAEAMPAGEVARFVTATGWEVELTQARLELGPTWLLEKSAPSASFSPLRLFVREAHAHSGFDDYDGGEVRGERLEPVTLDLLQPGLLVPSRLRGLAGRVRSVSLELGSDDDGNSAWVEGVARKAGEEIRFAGGLRVDDPKKRRVVGIPASLDLEDGATVVLEVHPSRWLQHADFSSLPEGSEVRPISIDSQAHAAFSLGARGFGAFTLRTQ